MNQDPQPNETPPEEVDYSKPVAYDKQGRPLYARPPEPAASGQSSEPASEMEAPQSGAHHYVHIARPMDPAHPEIPPEIKRRHEASAKQYPRLNLSDGEFIISAIKRHPIGLFEIWGVALLIILALAGVMAGVLAGNDLGNSRELALLGAAGLGMISFLILGGAFVAAYVYNSNRFYLTNESVIQEIQVSLFSKHEQTVSLANIEDASFRQDGILPHIFNYGTIRLSTEGDETTYRFTYVANPKRHIAVLNNAVEAFKNGRPVTGLADE